MASLDDLIAMKKAAGRPKDNPTSYGNLRATSGLSQKKKPREIYFCPACADAGRACLRSKAKVDAAFFSQKVKPILEKSCLGCHGVDNQLSHFDLRSREGALKGGTRGAGFVPGSAEKSLLFKLVEGKQAPLMPPGGKLPASERAILKTWLDGGAPWAGAGKLATAKKQVWWSFAPLKTPSFRARDERSREEGSEEMATP